jgi:hypothetical protein
MECPALSLPSWSVLSTSQCSFYCQWCVWLLRCHFMNESVVKRESESERKRGLASADHIGHTPASAGLVFLEMLQRWRKCYALSSLAGANHPPSGECQVHPARHVRSHVIRLPPSPGSTLLKWRGKHEDCHKMFHPNCSRSHSKGSALGPIETLC